MQPFIFPAMGSHGAATAEGQADVLAHYGITKPPWAAPCQPLDVVSLGKTADGIEAFMDRRRLRIRRRDAGRPRQMAHRFRRQDRERPLQDDGHRPRQIRRRAALPRLRLPARAGARDSLRRAAGLAVRQDSRRPGHSGRRQSQHRANSTPSRWKRWSSAKKNSGAGEIAGWPASRRTSTS